MTIPPAEDLHWKTVEEDESFHTFMDALDTIFGEAVGWRQRMNDRQKRMHAKTWDFGRLYGIRAGMKKIIDTF